MAKTNIKTKSNLKTAEGAPARRINGTQMLRRSIMACMLWEKSFYEDGVSIADRIKDLVPVVDPNDVAAMAVEAREKMKLRHAPLFLVRELARHPKQAYSPGLVAMTLARVIQRADELAEFVAMYWKDGKQPLSAQVKKGLALAFPKFNRYNLAKYNRDGDVTLRDVLFLCHAKPLSHNNATDWKDLVDGKLEAPDTWEVELSAGKDKKETFERLMLEKKLGALALLRNLRNMAQAKVSPEIVQGALLSMSVERVLPFRFIAAAKYVPQWEQWLESAMLKALDGRGKLPGRTVLLCDVSGSTDAPVSAKSDLTRRDAIGGLAILARELCEDVAVYSFSNEVRQQPARHGFALRDALETHYKVRGRSGNTFLGAAVKQINDTETFDRIIVITDEQTRDVVPNPKGKGYLINVSVERNGVGYGPWTHVDGFSENIFDYIVETEKGEEDNG